MKVVLINTDKFVKANALQEITDPIVLNRNFRPTQYGLLSTEIFGTSTYDRKRTFAYISLNCHVFHPLVYKVVKKIDRRIDSIIAGTKTYKITAKGELVEDPAGDTGIDWLYKNWEKIKWKKNESRVRNERIDLLNAHTKNELFQDKEIVCPAFYRDVNLQSSKAGKPSIHKINQPYSKLIRLASTLTQGDFAFTLNYTKFTIQQTLVDIYDYFKARIEKKRGLIKQFCLGKSVDYGARVVISTADFTFNRMEDQIIDFFHTGVPLAHVISTFTPFFAGWVQNFFRREFELVGYKYPFYDKKTGQIVHYEVKDPMVQFSDEKIKDMMTKYIYSYSERFDPIEIETTDKKKPTIGMLYRGRYPGESEENDLAISAQKKRYMTLTDLFYLAAVDITRDKHVYVTRYPMTSHLGTYPSRISVLTTVETEPVIYDGVEYKHYPKVEIGLDKDEVPKRFINVVQMQNTFLKATGGDYDGDQITIKGVFSQEANLEAEKIMKSPAYLLSSNGSNLRVSTIEVIQALYCCTRWKNPNEHF